MLSRITLAALAVGSFAAFAAAAPELVVTGHHNGVQNYIAVDKPVEPTPYTLVRDDNSRARTTTWTTEVRVGNRIVVPATPR